MVWWLKTLELVVSEYSSLLLFSTLKEFWISIRFWQSYHHQLGSPLFGAQCRWNSTGCRRRLCLRLLWPLTFWPSYYISCAGTYMTQFWWKYLQIYCIHPVFRAITCSDLDLWPLTKSESAHRRTQIHLWPKLREIPFIGLWDMVFTFTRFSGHCLLWQWRNCFT